VSETWIILGKEQEEAPITTAKRVNVLLLVWTLVPLHILKRKITPSHASGNIRGVVNFRIKPGRYA
jgi:hypothetical protein